MKQWEYKSVGLRSEQASIFSERQVNFQRLDHIYNQLGREGWELVSIIDTNFGHGVTQDVVATFKRALIEA